MKGIINIIGFAFFFILGFSSCENSKDKNSDVQYMQIERIDNSIKIPVSDVELADFKLEEYQYDELISKLTSGKIEAYPINYQNENFVYTRVHPVIGALHYSFAHHRPIVISPDMIWLMIMQGFSKHIYFNSDVLKSDIYNNSEIKEILIQRDDFVNRVPTNNWNEVFPEMTKHIKANINESFYELMLPSFTTSTENISISYQITMMDALSEFYSYNVATACGIPYIILEGSEEDWKWIKDQLHKLKKYDLDFWIDNLQPIIDKIYETSTGKVDIEFWKSIYKWNSDSGGNKVTGWIIIFFPYLETTDNSKKINQSLEVDLHFNNDTIAWIIGLEGDDFTSGMSVCDFTWKYFYENLDMQFYAGFVGIKQDTNLILKPEINWFVAEKQPNNINENRINKGFDWSVSYSLYAKELDLIIPCRDSVAKKIDEFCSEPDTFAIFNPTENKSFEFGKKDFVKQLTELLKNTEIKGKLEFSVLVFTNGYATPGKFTEKDMKYYFEIWEILGKMPKWKTATKNGKSVITEIEIKIES